MSLFNKPYTTITVAALTDADALMGMLRSPAAHNYPYRVFVAAQDSTPFYDTAVLVVHRDGWMYGAAAGDAYPMHSNTLIPADEAVLRNPIAGVFLRDAVWEAVRQQYKSHIYLRHRMRHWIEAWGRGVVELHPQRHIRVANTEYAHGPEAYWNALGVAMGAMSNRGVRYYRDHTRRTVGNTLRRAARDRAQPDDRALTAHWRGRVVLGSTYRDLRDLFRSEEFVEAMKAGKVDGDWAPLVNYLNDSPRARDPLTNARVQEMSDEEVILADCGHATLNSDAVTTEDGNHTFCRDCADVEFVYIDNCRMSDQGWYHREDVHYWNSDGEYHLEEEPDEDEDEDDEDDNGSGLLQSWGSSTSYLAHDKGFVPSQFGDFTMGIELEVESRDYQRGDALNDCNEQFNGRERYAMFKRDGSLDEAHGFEIVTAARRLTDHIQMFKEWQPHNSLISWSAGNCGMHVHIDSRAFSSLTLGKFLQFYNDPANAKFLRVIAGRHPDMDRQAESYAARVECDDPNPARIKKSAGRSRYRIVNLTNLAYEEQRRLGVDVIRDSKGSYSTVEIRIFRGTLKKERLLAQIEFAHASVQFCRVAGMHQLNGQGFLNWLGSCAGQYKHLARFLGVYVPRPTKQRPSVTLPAASAVEV